MSQDYPGTINPALTGGSELATFLNAFFSSLITGFSGPTRPSWAVAGTVYRNTTATPNVIYVCGSATNGSQDIPWFSLEPGAENSVLAYNDAGIPRPKSPTDLLASLGLFTNTNGIDDGLKGLVPGPTILQAGFVLKTTGWAAPDNARIIPQTITVDTALTSAAYARTLLIAATNKTITLPNPATASDGDFIEFQSKIIGTPRPTIARFGTETIDGNTTKTIFGYHSFRIVKSGSNWITVNEIPGIIRDPEYVTSSTYTPPLTVASRPVIYQAACTVTLPAHTTIPHPVGTQIDHIRDTASDVVFTPEAGVTLESEGGFRKIGAQHAGGSIFKTATNTWKLLGSLKA